MHVPDHCWVAVFTLVGLHISECFCFLYFCSCNESEAGMTPSGKLLCVLVQVQPSAGCVPTVPGWDALTKRNLGLLSDAPGPHLQSQLFNSSLNGTLFSPLLIPKNSIWPHAGERESTCMNWKGCSVLGKRHVWPTHQCLEGMLTSTLPWGDISGLTRRKTLRLESVGLGLSPTLRHDGAAQCVASQCILFQGKAILRSRGNYGW